MQGFAAGFIAAVLFAFTVIGADTAVAQDMPPILAPPAVAAPPKPAPASPSAEAIIAPAAPTPAPAAPPAAPPAIKKPQVAATSTHPTQTHRHAKFTALMKRLTAARNRAQHEAQTRHASLHRTEPSYPPGPMPPPPPGYYPPGFRQHLVYGGPPPGFYGWGGYRDRYLYDYP